MDSKVKRRTLWGILAVAGVLLLSFNFLVSLRLDFLWHQSVQYASVFWRSYLWKVLVGAAIFAVVLGSSMLNLGIAFKRSGQNHFGLRMSAIAMAISVVIWLEAGDVWFMVLQALNATAFNVADPQFGLDIRFYVFMVPFFQLIYRVIMTWLTLNLAGSALIYVFSAANRQPSGPEVEVEAEKGSGYFQKISPLHPLQGTKGLVEWKGWGHCGILLGLLIGLQSLRFGLNIFEMMYAQGNIVAGAGAADIEMKLPGYYIMAGFSLVSGLLIAVSARHKLRRAALAFGAFLILNIAVIGALPQAYQQFIVAPNEISQETPYLERSIKYTNMAYNLDEVEEREYPVGDLTVEDLKNNQDVISNIRLLDQRATLTTYGQQQELRPYYEFADVDVDRYTIDGYQTQVMVSAREMNQEELPQQAQSFNNQMFQYTHGFGLVMSPANRTTSTGLPDYFIKDIPPVSTNLTVSQPRIYFGEKTENNVIVKTKLAEFDYTDGENNKEYFYEGDSGIPMTLGNRLLLSFRDMQYKYLFSGYITGDSRYLETRNVRERAARIAPFLWYDTDPYVVLTDEGRLVYIIDAFTQTGRYPYSEAANEIGYNYIRNSAKVTVDAYSGEINFYLFDEEDPIVATYAKIYPGLFKARSDFPEDLMEHVRYPEAMFQVQSQMLQDYHMSNPVVFYNREDRWAFAEQVMGNERLKQDPYYTISRLPGEEKEEFVLLRNFTPSGKQNMIAWLAGRSDGEDYGKLLLYTFSKGTQVPGPMQVESQIDQNPEISAQLSLWGQGGSTLIRGNLLVYPLEDSLLYVEPLYMESTQNKFPQLKRVFVYYKDRIVMAESLSLALDELFPGYIQDEEEPDKEEPTKDGVDQEEESQIPADDLDALLNRLIQLQRDGKAALGEGDWNRYGEIQQEMDRIFARIEAITASKAAAAAPGAESSE